MKCLFVIDVQNGFISSKTSHVVPRLVQLMDAFDDGIIIATKFANHSDSPYNRFLGWSKLSGAPETDLLPDVVRSAHHIVEKSIYYACTEEAMCILRENNVSEAYVVGIDTDCCVLKTAADLFERGIRPVVLTHYCASNGGDASHRAAITVLSRTIGKQQIIEGVVSSL